MLLNLAMSGIRLCFTSKSYLSFLMYLRCWLSFIFDRVIFLKGCYINLYHMVQWAVILKICSFFYREHHPFYESFLSTVVGKDETRHKVSKTIDNLFKLLSSLLNKQVNYWWGIGQKLLINYQNDQLFVITIAVVNFCPF